MYAIFFNSEKLIKSLSFVIITNNNYLEIPNNFSYFEMFANAEYGN